MSPASNPNRLLQVDALRGLAALAVVLFHLTTRFQQVYHPVQAPSFSVPHGHYGVNLFFIVSGFVIFMTLNRTRHGTDFVVSRFSRLYPTYWAAIGLTFCITHALAVPEVRVSLGTAAMNLLMFHGFFGFKHVDGVYWTLEVELLFYLWMYLLFKAGRLDQVFVAMLALLALRWVYFGFQQLLGIDLPWIAYRLLILPYLPWFMIGVAIYAIQGHPGAGRQRTQALWAAAAAVLTLAVTESVATAGLAVALGLVVFWAAAGRLPALQWRVFVWLGAISYPLYLVHENIGWSLMHLGLRNGQSIDLLILMTLPAVLLLAHLVSKYVEQPAMSSIRRAYRHRRPTIAGEG